MSFITGWNTQTESGTYVGGNSCYIITTFWSNLISAAYKLVQLSQHTIFSCFSVCDHVLIVWSHMLSFRLIDKHDNQLKIKSQSFRCLHKKPKLPIFVAYDIICSLSAWWQSALVALTSTVAASAAVLSGCFVQVGKWKNSQCWKRTMEIAAERWSV